MKSKLVGTGRRHFAAKEPVNVCDTCGGRGYTKETATTMRDKRTTALGSGCPECRGKVAQDER